MEFVQVENWLIDWLIVWWIDWVSDWLIDWYTYWLNDKIAGNMHALIFKTWNLPWADSNVTSIIYCVSHSNSSCIFRFAITHFQHNSIPYSNSDMINLDTSFSCVLEMLLVSPAELSSVQLQWVGLWMKYCA